MWRPNRSDAANRCIDGLKSIDAHDGLHNPHGWGAAGSAIAGIAPKVLTELSGLADRISGLSAVLLLVALPLCPELSLVLFAVATQAVAVKLAADGGRELAGEHVGWRTFALDAFASIPVAGPAKGAAGAFRAAREAEDLAGGVAAASRAIRRPVADAFADAYAHEPADALKALNETGGLAKSVRASSWARTGDAISDVSRQDLLGYPVVFANNAYDNRRPGVAQAIGLSAFRVTWEPIGDTAELPVMVARDATAQLDQLPHLLGDLGGPGTGAR